MARAGTARGGSRQGGRQQGGSPVERTLPVGRPLQARLIALEKRLGVFSEEQSFAADSRFNHPVLLPAERPAAGAGAAGGEAASEGRAGVPEGMARIFAAELASLERLGKDPGICHATRVGPYTVYCRSYFHYDGFRALLYLEREGRFLAAWMEQEVHQPDSPRTLLSAVDGARIEALLGEVLADLA